MIEDSEALIEARAVDAVRTHREMLTELVALRDRHGLTQHEMAYRMGVSQPTVAAFERYDSNPTLATIRRYAVAVGARFRIEVIDDYAPDGWERDGSPERDLDLVDPTVYAPEPVRGGWASLAGLR